MDNDKTVLKPQIYHAKKPVTKSVQPLSQPATLIVSLYNEQKQLVHSYAFTASFKVGRATDNNIIIDSPVVSRQHMQIKAEANDWWVYNLNSANGVYIDNKLVVNRQKLSFPVSIFFGRSPIHLSLQTATTGEDPEGETVKLVLPVLPTFENIAAVKPARKTLSEEEIKARYLADEEAEDAGEHTRFVRRLIIEDRTVRVKSYKKIIWILSILFTLAVSLVTYQHLALNNTRKLAIDMFYDIKGLEVSLSQADLKLEESASALDKTMQSIADEKLKIAQDQIKVQHEKIQAEKIRMLQERKKLADMKAKYQQYINQARSLELRFPTTEAYEEDLIAKVARDLGESELELPDDFVKEVKQYIKFWQASGRMQAAMEKIQSNGFLNISLAALEQSGLPLYFVYLPLQESDYNEYAVGPETRYGVAKGAWQLLASTAQDFGIAAGPLANSPEFDAQDQRFDFNLATQAATKYLKKIYSTEAQASGLLVMASYNYGDNRVRTMISNMPDNPRDKNFWKFAKQYELPRETHDYVLYIFSAAVIGEDPKHFGFSFAPPLFKAEAQSHS